MTSTAEPQSRMTSTAERQDQATSTAEQQLRATSTAEHSHRATSTDERQLRGDDVRLAEVSLADAELKNQKALESISQLEEEKSELTDLVNTLFTRELEQGELLCHTQLEVYELENEREQKHKAHSALLLEYEEIKKELTRTEEVLKVSLADAELKNQKALESISQLEEEKSELTDLVNTLFTRELEQGELLCHTQLEVYELENEREQKHKAHSALLLEYEEIKKELTRTEEVLKVSLADAELKNQKALESISQLEEEKSELTDLVNTLFTRELEQGELLCHTQLEVYELENEREQKHKAHSALLLEYEEIKKELTRTEEVLKVSLADAELKNQKALESISQLEEEKSELTDLVNTLFTRELEQGELLCHTQLEVYELENEREQKHKAHSALLLEYEEIKKELTRTEEVLKVSLADAELKNQKALESISQLEEEKSELTDLVNTLFTRELEQGELLCHTQLEVYELENEREQKHKAHSALLLEYEEIKKELTRTEEVLKVSLADAELKNQKALESISQLEEEKSELTDLVNTLFTRELEQGELLCHTQLEVYELENEREQKHKAHSALLLEYEEIKKELTRTEEVLKVSLADAELKNQKALESISQLEEEKSELTDLVNTLFTRELEQGELLCHTQLEVYELENEREQKHKAHSALLLEYEEIKKELTRTEEVLKVSLADAELKNQKALESISQLEEEKSELTDLVNTLFTRELEQGELLCHTQLEVYELENEREQKHKAHSALLLEYEEIKKELTRTEEVLKVSLADPELKNQKALESISQLEEEKSELTDLVNTLFTRELEQGELLCHTQLEVYELENEREKKHKAHSALLLEYEEIKKELTRTEEVLKVSLTDAELKNQKALESISQLEEEKSELTKLVNTLRSTVEDLEGQLCDSNLHFDKLKNVCFRLLHPPVRVSAD
ncbi:hypothetical protein QTP70_018023 [Hemibagrus guttatus]|uniref:Uncharacterized protein n=1 Tax=Hemibagrus guttatus TaxID=175788 RepID=A0AAE0PRV8_9TELE|nr:hypothetical protein QTP70_018023 [Hemibagrus guttatus]